MPPINYPAKTPPRAAAQAHTGAMIALIPSAEDAERLAVDGGEPVGELHCTLAYLGDAADWDDDARQDITDWATTIADRAPVDADGFALSLFNPGGDEPCIVLILGGAGLDDIHEAVLAQLPEQAPEQRAPWIPHLTLVYDGDPHRLADLVDRTGPIVFDRLRVAFAGDHTDIPLVAAEPVNNRIPEVPAVKRNRPIARGRHGATGYRINNLAGSGAAEIYIYDEIGWYGVEAQQFVRDLNTIDANRIDVHINSPGGDCFDGIAIYQALRNHKAEITTYVDSLAASAASFIALAGDKRVVAPHGMVMIHDAWGFCMGNATDMAKMTDELGRMSDNIASIYASRAGGEVADWRDLMRAETWFSAEEAVQAGLMQRVQPDADKSLPDDARNTWDLSIFNFAGRDKAPPPRIPRQAAGLRQEPPPGPDPDPVPDQPEPSTPPDPDGVPVSPAAEPGPPTENPVEDDVSDLSDIARGLGLPDDAGKDQILAAIVNVRQPAEPADQPDPDEAPDDTDVPDSTPADVPPSVPDRVNEPTPAEPVAQLDDNARAEIARLSAELADIKAEKAAAAKKALFDSAVAAGKLKPADRKTWENRYDKAPDVIVDILAATAPHSAVPTNAIGHTGSNEPDSDADWDAAMARLDGPYAHKGV